MWKPPAVCEYGFQVAVFSAKESCVSRIWSCVSKKSMRRWWSHLSTLFTPSSVRTRCHLLYIPDEAIEQGAGGRCGCINIQDCKHAPHCSPCYDNFFFSPLQHTSNRSLSMNMEIKLQGRNCLASLLYLLYLPQVAASRGGGHDDGRYLTQF